MILRSLLLLFAAALGAAVLVAAVVSAAGLLFVSVATADQKLTLPIPIALPRAALPFIPDHVFEDALDPADEKMLAGALEAAGALAGALRDVPDGFTLVEVRERETSVEVGKEGGDLVVRVDDAGARVRVRAPLAVLDGMTAACDTAGCDLKRLARKVLGEMRDLRIEVRDAENDVKLYAF